MKCIARAVPMLADDEVPIGAVIVSRGEIEVFSDDGIRYNTYTALVYVHDGKRYAIYLDKAAKVFRSVEV